MMEKKAGSPKTRPPTSSSSLRRVWRGVKTLFFLAAMLSSLLFSGPLLVAALDMLLPSALYSTSVAPLSPASLAAQLRSYDIRASLADLPLLSIARSLLIICVYSLCQGPALSRWPYLGITVLCSLASAGFVFVKASLCAGVGRWHGAGGAVGREGMAVAGLYMSSWALAVAHMVVAYRTSCRERRKMLVFRIDLEAVTAYKNGFSSYNKLSY
uniref:Putative membrane protein ycf1 n=1 Tax=Anthurium amnicola TaxID=1678845 RepID=A0A1D1ZLZ9_9ARAE